MVPSEKCVRLCIIHVERDGMTTKMVVDSSVCGYKTLITAEKEGACTRIRLDSGCSCIKRYNDCLREVEKGDLYSMIKSRIMEKASECSVSATCIVPAAIMNACWIENGLISKNLALEKKELKIVFKE
jgi:hypothetical protein